MVARYRGRVRVVDIFDTFAKPEDTERFVRSIESLPRGCVVALAVCDTASELFSSRAQKAIESIGGKIGLIRQKSRCSYICIGFKGMPSGQAIEMVENFKKIDYPSIE